MTTARPLLIDSHGREVVDPVWALYAHTIKVAGPRPTLIEWDNDVPDWPTLAAEAARADSRAGQGRRMSVGQSDFSRAILDPDLACRPG